MDLDFRLLWLSINNSMLNNEKALLDYRKFLHELDQDLDKDWKIFHDSLTKDSQSNLFIANLWEFATDMARIRKVVSSEKKLITRQTAAATGRKRVEGLRALLQYRKENLEPINQMIQHTKRMGKKISHQVAGRKGGFTAGYNKYGKDVLRRRSNEMNLKVARALADEGVSSALPDWLSNRETRNRVNLSVSDAAFEELMATAEGITLGLKNIWDEPSFENIATSILAVLDILDPVPWIQKWGRMGFSANEAFFDDLGVAYAKAHAIAKNNLHTELRQIERELADIQAFKHIAETLTISPWE